MQIKSPPGKPGGQGAGYNFEKHYVVWVTKAMENGAKLISVDPRFTRTAPRWLIPGRIPIHIYIYVLPYQSVTITSSGSISLGKTYTQDVSLPVSIPYTAQPSEMASTAFDVMLSVVSN